MKQRMAAPGTAIHAIATERDRVRAFKAARRHTWLVRTLRFLLPVAGLVAVGGFASHLAITAYLRPRGVEVSAVRIDTKNLTMETPRYEGFGKDGSRYHVKAREAITDLKRTGPVRLNAIDGVLTQTTGVVTNLKAVWGTYDEKKDILELYEKIDVDGSTGMRARLTRATVFTKESRVISDEPVWLHNETGTITARSMVLRQREHKAAFKDDVHVTLRPAQQSQPAQLRGTTDAAGAPSAEAEGKPAEGKPAEGKPAKAAKAAARSRTPTALPGLAGNSGQPIEVRSVTLDVDDTARTALFRREVVARQGEATLAAPELDVHYEGRATAADGAPRAKAAAGTPGEEGTKLKFIKARGGVTTRNKDDTAVSATLDYDAATERAVLTGDVVLTSTGDRRATADAAEFDQKTERAVLTGRVVMTSGEERRVTGDRAEFDQKADTALVTGADVVATQGRNVLKGRRIFVDRKASTTRLESPAADGLPAGRINTVFYQEEKTAGAKGAKSKAAAKRSETGGDGGPLAMTFKTDPNSPIEVDADTLDVFDLKKQAVFKGKVVAKQGEFTVTTIEMIAHYTGEAGLDGASPVGQAAPRAKGKAKGEGGGESAQLTRIEANQKVVITSRDGREVVGDWAIHDVKSNMMTVGGKVFVTDGKSSVAGPDGSRLLIDMNTGKSTFEQAKAVAATPGAAQPAISASGPMTSAAPGAASPSCPPGSICTKERFQLVLYPKEVEAKAKSKVGEIVKDADGWATTESKEGKKKKKKPGDAAADPAAAAAVKQ